MILVLKLFNQHFRPKFSSHFGFGEYGVIEISVCRFGIFGRKKELVDINVEKIVQAITQILQLCMYVGLSRLLFVLNKENRISS